MADALGVLFERLRIRVDPLFPKRYWPAENNDPQSPGPIDADALDRAVGASVTTTVRAVGYRKPSAFISAFSRVTGHTPGTYLHTD
ncbi:helix-turn-helix domain-containing protein [Streptomyces jietaisiensis]|uniref:hypothetical protein n=1 Tax=Streptomyces griseoaurantiacus TaxID=68213 RepID=UPI00324E2D8D